MDTCDLGEQRLPRKDWVMECVVRKRGDLLQAPCEFIGGITRQLASWFDRFFPVALQGFQDSGKMVLQ